MKTKLVGFKSTLNLVKAIFWAAGMALISTWPGTILAQAGYSYITNFSKTGNDQANLQSSFPAGVYYATNSFATPFNVTTNASGKNYSEIFGAGSTLIISNVGLQNVSTVYTLMNAYSPVSGPLASVEFIGSAGADQTFTLVGGVDLRDFYQGSWQNTINGTTTQMAYQTNNVVGAAGTGNSATGLVGTYRLDEQEFQLSSAFLSQTLQTIIISNMNGSSTPFVVAVTAQQVNPRLLFSETFTNPSYNPGWKFENVNPASSNSLDGTTLTIEASYQNGGSDLYSGTEYAAPRLLQLVNPSLDWIIETKFDFAPTDNYQGAGILLADTNGVFQSDADFSRIAERAYYPNGGGSVIRSVGNYVNYSSGTCWLRVQKIGTNYTGWYSSDGISWILNGTAVMTNQWTYAGLFTIRYDWTGNPVNSMASFYYFKATILPPALSIQAANEVADVSWPATSSNYVLEVTGNLGNPNWTLVTNLVSVVNGNCQVSLTPTNNSRFFRLVYP